MGALSELDVLADGPRVLRRRHTDFRHKEGLHRSHLKGVFVQEPHHRRPQLLRGGPLALRGLLVIRVNQAGPNNVAIRKDEVQLIIIYSHCSGTNWSGSSGPSATNSGEKYSKSDKADCNRRRFASRCGSANALKDKTARTRLEASTSDEIGCSSILRMRSCPSATARSQAVVPSGSRCSAAAAASPVPLISSNARIIASSAELTATHSGDGRSACICYCFVIELFFAIIYYQGFPIESPSTPPIAFQQYALGASDGHLVRSLGPDGLCWPAASLCGPEPQRRKCDSGRLRFHFG